MVGDGAVGKTCMVTSYIDDKFPTDYVPTVFDAYKGNLTVEGSVRKLILWDTAGQEDLRDIRNLAYPNTSVFLICFSLCDPISFSNVTSHWV